MTDLHQPTSRSNMTSKENICGVAGCTRFQTCIILVCVIFGLSLLVIQGVPISVNYPTRPTSHLLPKFKVVVGSNDQSGELVKNVSRNFTTPASGGVTPTVIPISVPRTGQPSSLPTTPPTSLPTTHQLPSQSTTLSQLASNPPTALVSPGVNATEIPTTSPQCIPDPNKKVSVTFMGRLGNQLFLYASLYGISRTNCRTPLCSLGGSDTIRNLFSNLTVPFTYSGGATLVRKEEVFGKFDKSLTTLADSPHIHVTEYLQSFKYFQPYQADLRLQLKTKEGPLSSAKKFLSEIKSKLAANQSGEITFVGIHQRRGDMLTTLNTNIGYLTAGATYFQKAMDYFRKKYHNVHFLVATDDKKWVKANLKGEDFTLTGQSAIVDFVILTCCNHTIMSVGTFGWWAGWLAGGEVVYKDPPFRPGSQLYGRYKKEDFFPSDWVGMSE